LPAALQHGVLKMQFRVGQVDGMQAPPDEPDDELEDDELEEFPGVHVCAAQAPFCCVQS
jgi:hypothetical protein